MAMLPGFSGHGSAISLGTTGGLGFAIGLTTDGILSSKAYGETAGWVMGFGEPTELPAPVPVPVDFYGWGWGDPDPDTLHAASSSGLTWTGAEYEWGFGDPDMFLAEAWIIWGSELEQPDDGGEIVELRAAWPEIGPWQISLTQHFTGTTFPTASSPVPFCKSPVPGFGTRCYTNVVQAEVGGMLVDLPGNKLRFVLPPLPPGLYDVEITAGGSPSITVSNAFQVIWRNRALETYTLRNRFPSVYSLGQRLASVEILLGIDPESDQEIT